MSDLNVTPGVGHTLRMNDLGGSKNAQVVAAVSAQGTVTGKGSADVTTAVALSTLFSGGVTPAGTGYVLVTVDGADIRYWEDGTSPTSTSGLIVKDGGAFEIVGLTNINNCKLIAVSGTARVNVQAKRYDQ